MKISEITAFLEGAYEVLNGEYFDGMLPPVVITVQSSPKSYGHYTTVDVWHEGKNQSFREINLSAETLDRDIVSVIATLLHESVHHYCSINGIKDCSRSSVYHNKYFKAECEKRNLQIEYDPKIGWSITRPTVALLDFVQKQGWDNLELFRKIPQGISDGENGKSKKKSSTRKYQCPQCGCSVRATKEVLIGCIPCGQVMHPQQ